MSRPKAVRDAFGKKFRAKFARIPTGIQEVQNVSRANSMQGNYKPPLSSNCAMRFLYVPLPVFAAPERHRSWNSSA